MHPKAFVKLKKNPKNPFVRAKNPKKPKKPKKNPKKPTGLGFFKNTRVFSNPELNSADKYGKVQDKTQSQTPNFASSLKNIKYFIQCWGSGSGWFWASRIRIHQSEVRILIRIRILSFSHKGVERTEIMLAKENFHTKFAQTKKFLRLKIMCLLVSYKKKI